MLSACKSPSIHKGCDKATGPRNVTCECCRQDAYAQDTLKGKIPYSSFTAIDFGCWVHTHTHTQIGLFLVARPTYFLQFWDDLSWMYRRYVGYYLRNGATNNNDQLRQPSRVQKSFHTTTSGFNPTLKSLHKPFSLNSLKSLPTEALADCFSLLMQKWFTPLCVTSLVFYPVWAPTWAIFWINNSTWKTIFFFLL